MGKSCGDFEFGVVFCVLKSMNCIKVKFMGKLKIVVEFGEMRLVLGRFERLLV
jgi:hypothetical protein